MKRLTCKNWSITARVVLIATVPVALMFVSILLYFYYSRSVELEEELAEDGRLIASLLAESSEYGVISGNLSDLGRTIRSLLQVDKSIDRVEVLDREKRPLMQITRDTTMGQDSRVFEAPIRREVVAVGTFDLDSLPHFSASLDLGASTPLPNATVGYVRVSVSPVTGLGKQRQRLLVGAAIAGAALIFSVMLGLALAIGLTRPLAKTLEAVRSIRRGAFVVHADRNVGGEIGELQAAIVEMAASLDRSRKELEDQVLARTRELQAARDDALKSNAERMRLIQRVNATIEDERKSIANEIHDHLNATLIVVRLEAQRILTLAKRDAKGLGAQEVAARAQGIVKLTGELYELARDIVRRLRPEIIDTLGLRAAVEEMVRHYDNVHPKCRFEFEAQGDLSGLTSEISIAAYRLVQEALSNVVKHAAATRTRVRLGRAQSGTILRIEVSDNGRGFDHDTVEPGIGLIGMRERVLGLGGQIEIVSVDTKGTNIVIELPVEREGGDRGDE